MKTFAVVTLAIMLLCGCQKGEGGAKTNAQLLATGSWRFESAMVDSDNNGTGDFPVPAGILEVCQTDNLLFFQESGSGTVDEGPTKCDASDPQTVPFTWNFTTNETVINFSSA